MPRRVDEEWKSRKVKDEGCIRISKKSSIPVNDGSRVEIEDDDGCAKASLFRNSVSGRYPNLLCEAH